MKDYMLLLCHKKTGKVDKMLEAKSQAQLKVWALEHTTPTKQSVIFEKETGNVVCLVVGEKGSLPKIEKDNLGNIADYNPQIIDEIISTDDKLLKIAMNHSCKVKERGSLDTKYNDDEDFIELSVWGLKRALKEAYELGLKEGKKK